MRRLNIQRSALGQGLFNERLPDYVDLLIPEEPRSQVEAEFVGALRHAVNDFLGERGYVSQIHHTFANTGYVLLVVKPDKSTVSVTFSYDDAIKLGEGAEGTKGMFDRVTGMVIQRVKEQMGGH